MTLAAETPRFVWYLMRGTGLVALVLLSLTTALGVVGVRRWQSPRWPRLVTAGLHRNLSLLALCFLAVHIATAMVDSWVGLGWIGAVVPFVSHYRPLWVGLGVLAADILLAVVATSLLRRRLPYRAWRAVHWGAWLMWPLAVAHALGAGTDTGGGWGLGLCLACVGLVATAGAWRLSDRGRTPARRGRPAPAPRGPLLPVPTDHIRPGPVPAMAERTP